MKIPLILCCVLVVLNIVCAYLFWGKNLWIVAVNSYAADWMSAVVLALHLGRNRY